MSYGLLFVHAYTRDLNARALARAAMAAPAAHALFLPTSCLLKRTATRPRLPFPPCAMEGTGHWASGLPCHSHSISGA